MRKYLLIINWLAIALWIIACIAIGIHLADGNYDFLPWAYIAFACVAVTAICSLLRALGAKCSCCGKRITSAGKFCPYCGKAI